MAERNKEKPKTQYEKQYFFITNNIMNKDMEAFDID